MTDPITVPAPPSTASLLRLATRDAILGRQNTVWRDRRHRQLLAEYGVGGSGPPCRGCGTTGVDCRTAQRRAQITCCRGCDHSPAAGPVQDVSEER